MKIRKRMGTLMLLAVAALALFPAAAFGKSKKVMTREEIYRWSTEGNKWLLYSVEENSYDSKGRIKKTKTTDMEDDGLTVYSVVKTKTKYKSGRVYKESFYEDEKLQYEKTYTYYTKGKTKGKIKKTVNKKGKKKLESATYYYNKKGNLTQIKVNYYPGKETIKVKQKYKNKVLRSDARTDQDYGFEKWNYDSKGRLTKYQYSSEGHDSVTHYYTNGFMKDRRIVYSEGIHEIHDETFFEDGLPKTHNIYDEESGDLFDSYTYTRAESGNTVTVTATNYRKYVATFKTIKY